MGAAIVPVLVNAEVAALPTEVKFVKAAITGIAGLFHKHVNAGASTTPTIAAGNIEGASAAQYGVLSDLKAVEPLLLALAKEFGGITIPTADLPMWESAVKDAIVLVGKVHNLMNTGKPAA